MAERSSDSNVTRLCGYTIASADMYYSEMGQRDVFICVDGQKGFCIWGEMSGAGPSSAINLCDIFLEYALYSKSWCSSEEARYNMVSFGERLGRSLGKYFQKNFPGMVSGDVALKALECILAEMNASPSIEHSESEVCFVVSDFPLEEAARHSGLRDVELAHYGINAMCESLVHTMNPSLTISVSSEIRPEFAFTIMGLVYA
jgi:hypothetical protein